ncbi:MAG: LysE family translocator, partial [Shewanella sp.]
MDLPLLFTLALIHTVALISPGPDFALMVKIATQQSRAAALAAALGISAAILIHTLCSLTGVSVVIANSQSLYLLVQAIGASYLAWMGYGALRSGASALRTGVSALRTGDSALRLGCRGESKEVSSQGGDMPTAAVNAALEENSQGPRSEALGASL